MKESTAKALIVNTAKAHGVKNIKGQTENVTAAFGTLRGSIGKLAGKGKGKQVPSNQVYSDAELYSLSKQVRDILLQMQNMPDDRFQTLREVKDRIQTTSQKITRLVGINASPKATADYTSRKLTDLMEDVEYMIRQTREEHRPRYMRPR